MIDSSTKGGLLQAASRHKKMATTVDSAENLSAIDDEKKN